MNKPIVLIHGYSSEGRSNSSEDIYGTLPADLRRQFGPGSVREINLSRWISLDDGVSLDDVSFAMERALRSKAYRGLLDSGFHVVIHSTGALVVRNWLRLYSARPSPIANLVHLAGANFGSGLAHIGRGTLARWYRQIFQGVEAGVQLLEELEFGSAKTLDMHLHFLQAGSTMDADYQVREFCAIGSQTLKALRVVPVRYVKEDSSDNTVRTSSCNLNFNHLRVTPTPAAYELDFDTLQQELELRLEDDKISLEWYGKDVAGLATNRRPVPFALLYETAHFGSDLGIVAGTRTRKDVLPLLQQALTTTDDEAAYLAVVAAWDKVTERTLARAGRLKGTLTDWSPQAQYEGHSQLVFRIRDQFGDDVTEHDITFNSGGRGKVERLEKMIEDKHRNRRNPGTTTYYLRTQKYGRKAGSTLPRNLLEDVAPLDFEVTGHEPHSDEISYLPVRIRLTAAEVRTVVQPFRTTLIEVTMLRLPSRKVFTISRAK